MAFFESGNYLDRAIVSRVLRLTREIADRPLGRANFARQKCPSQGATAEEILSS